VPGALTGGRLPRRVRDAVLTWPSLPHGCPGVI
jgi:hypothetical protein